MNSSLRLVILYVFLLFIFASCSDSPVASNNNEKADASTENSSASGEIRKKTILFFGNSITAGYGLESNEAFTYLIQQRLDSLGMDYTVINAGVSGETTATGSNRVQWVVERQLVDIFVLELGANDGLRGVPVDETKRNLEKIIDTVRKIHPDAKIILAGMMIPPSMGPEYSNAFAKIFPEIALNRKVTLIPFILNHVAGIDSLNLPDGIHPNAKGGKIVMENIWEVLKDKI